MSKKRITKHFLALVTLLCVMTFGLFLYNKTFKTDVLISYVMVEDEPNIVAEQTEKINVVEELRNTYHNDDIKG